MIDLDVSADASPSNVMPNNAAHARAAFVLSSLHESPSGEGVKLMFPANKMAETILIKDWIVSGAKPIVIYVLRIAKR
jgi:hypothetical protein